MLRCKQDLQRVDSSIYDDRNDVNELVWHDDKHDVDDHEIIQAELFRLEAGKPR